MLRRSGFLAHARSHITNSVACTSKNNSPPLLESVEIKDYYSSEMQQLVPPAFLQIKNSTSLNYCFVANDQVSEIIVDKITSSISNYAVIIETNPGLGLITRQLLRSRIPEIYVLDPSPSDYVLQLIANHPGKLYHKKLNLTKVKEATQQTRLMDKLCGILIECAKPQDWKQSSSVKVIGTLGSEAYLKFLMRSIFCPHRIHQFGRIENYLSISSSVYDSLVSGKSSTSTRFSNFCLFNSVMDVEVLWRYSRKDVLPWQANMFHSKNENIMYLVKIVPKENLFDIYSDDDLTDLRNFIQIVARRKIDCVIDRLEKFYPGISISLIRDGLTYSTRAMDLSFEDLATLFRCAKENHNFKEVQEMLRENDAISPRGDLRTKESTRNQNYFTLQEDVLEECSEEVDLEILESCKKKT